MPRWSSAENRRLRMATDDAVAAQETRLAELTADRRDRLRWMLGFIDHEPWIESEFDRERNERETGIR